MIVAGEHRAFATELLGSGWGDDRLCDSTGNVSGKGHHGAREAHFVFSEQVASLR